MKKIEKDFLESFDSKLDTDLSFDEAFNKSDIKAGSKKKVPFFKRPSVLVTSFLLVTAVVVTSIVVPLQNTGGDNIANNSSTNEPEPVEPGDSGDSNESETPEMSGDTHLVLPWDQKSVIQKYPSFIYNEGTYDVYSTEKSKPIKNIYVKQKISDIEVFGYDVYESKKHTEQAELFKIDNVDETFSLAIKFNGDNFYYSYQNSKCEFIDLNDFLTKTDFKNSVKFKYARAVGNGTLGELNKEYYFGDIDENILFNYLFTDLDSKRINADRYGNKLFTTRMIIEKLGLDMNPLQISEDYTVEIFLNNIVFRCKLPSSNVEEFINYLIDNCQK